MLGINSFPLGPLVLGKMAAPLLLTIMAVTTSLPVNGASSTVERAEGLVRQWTAIEQQRAALSSDWREQQQIMKQRLQLLSEESKQLEGLLSTNNDNRDEVEQKRLELLSSQTEMESDQVALESTLSTALGAIESWQSQLPPPLQFAWQENLLELDDNESPDANVASEDNTQRLQTVLAVLTQFSDFQQRVSVNETLQGGSTLVKQVYLGVSHGWYVSADSSEFGYGHAAPEGWQWTTQVEVLPADILSVIAMLEKSSEAKLVTLPIVLTARVDGSDLLEASQ